MELSYILNHLGEDRENYYNAVTPPLMLSSNFSFRNTSEMREKLKTELSTPFYTRGYNPTVGILRKKLSALEGAEDALVFASGSAAIAAAVMSVVKSGDHVVCVAKPYSWTGNLLSKYLNNFGITVSFVEGHDPGNFRKEIIPATKLIYLESPNSLTFQLQDIEAVSNIAKEKNITTILDNTYNSPLNQQPMKMGIDIVVHSATKYLNGHSDVVAGVVVSDKKRIAKMMAEEYMTLGGIISAHDAWMMIRGLRTLELRVNRSSSSAQLIAEWMEKHPKIEKIYYPFLKSNPDFSLAKKQMKQGGGLMSVLLKTKEVAGVERFCDELKYFLLATSWGGHESLCFPMCALGNAESFKNKSSLPWNLVRLYIGLEDPEVLRKDLESALGKV
ncbi:MAG: aminotransferase class I/II-fold pyridoxal phosphate-dependent enzyme [Bacteroidetes bacterium]|nr:aminotransferase class I/II-fold pyridoxal phosphate-dependent enzyme [Bacteroidota bacterium]